MKIEHKFSGKNIALSELDTGEVFEFHQHIWMKITNEGNDQKENAVRLDTGFFVYLFEKILVTPLPNAKLVIE